jgi:excisionase family DNA binding protein
MTEDEKYLRDLGYAEDEWVLSGQQWYTAAEASAHLGFSDEYVRRLAEAGRIPGAILHDARRIGWRFPRSGLIAYLAEQRRNTEQRQRGDTTA